MATVTYWERVSEESPAVLLLLASPVVLSLGGLWADMSVDRELVGDPGSQELSWCRQYINISELTDVVKV